MDVEASQRGVDLRMRCRPKGEVVAFGKLMTALALMKGQPWVPYQVEVLEDRTAHIPLTVLARAVTKLVDAGGWRPDVEGILQACEAARLEIRDALKFEKCANCTDQGFTEFTDAKGVKRMKKCDCWHAHQAKVRELEAGDQPLALPAARVSDWTQAGEGSEA